MRSSDSVRLINMFLPGGNTVTLANEPPLATYEAFGISIAQIEQVANRSSEKLMTLGKAGLSMLAIR